MKLNSLLKYLNEVAPAEAPKGAPLGQYLFAPNRKGVPPEKNTPLETKIFNSLASHYEGEGSVKSIDKNLATLLALKNKGMYQKLLKPPEGLVYRFISDISPEEASALFLNNLPVEEIISVPNKAFYASPIGVIERPSKSSTVARGKTSVSSWTTEPTSQYFSTFAYSENGKVSILLVAKTQGNNFFIDPKEMSKLSAEQDNVSDRNDKDDNLFILNARTIQLEQEVIGYGPIDVLEASFIYFGAGIDYKVEMALMNNIPTLAKEYKSSKQLPSEAFKPLLVYCDSVLAKYATELPAKSIDKLRNSSDYKTILKYATSKGLVPANRFIDASEHATELMDYLIGYIDNAYSASSIIRDTSQTELLKALNLKIKRHW